MNKKLGRLNAAQIATLGPGRHHDGGGLYLVVGKQTGRSWVFRFRKYGKLHDYGLGPAHTINLALARRKAAACRIELYGGTNPAETRKAERQARALTAAKTMIFKTAAEKFIESHSAGWKGGRSEEQWRQSLTDHVLPVIGNLPVQAIDTAAVLRVLEPIWTTIPETASRVRGRIESILDWAKARGYRSGDNPASWRGHLDHLLPAKTRVIQVKNHPALPFVEAGAFMAKLRCQKGVAARALEFLILTATRSNEVLEAPWDEIDPTERVWNIPAERMKNRKPLRVPLSDAAVEVIDAMAKVRTGDFIFPGIKNARINDQALRSVLKDDLGRSDVSVHGFRSTFRDWAGENTNFPHDVCEAALAHRVGNKVSEAYQRGDLLRKRRQLMDAWAKYCSAPATDSKKVVPLRRKQEAPAL
jgi:integrase